MSSNPKYIGPGYWAAWHLKSIHADTEIKKAEIARNIALDISNFPCLECREHARNFVSRNNLLKTVKNKNPLSLFIWTVVFHNEVNLRLKKKPYTNDEALKMWSSDNICVENCDEDIVEPEQKKPEPEQKKPEPEQKKIESMLIRGF